MIKHPLILGMSFLLAHGASENGCEPPTPPDKVEQISRADRYADFNDTISIENTTSGASGQRQRTKLTFKFEPTRTGAYFIQAGEFENKYISSNEATANPLPPLMSLPVSTQTISIFYSDGKSFEKTLVKVEQ